MSFTFNETKYPFAVFGNNRNPGVWHFEVSNASYYAANKGLKQHDSHANEHFGNAAILRGTIYSMIESDFSKQPPDMLRNKTSRMFFL